MPQREADVEIHDQRTVELRREAILNGRGVFARFRNQGGLLQDFVRAVFFENGQEREHFGYLTDVRLSGFDQETQLQPGVIAISVGIKRIRMRVLLELKKSDPQAREVLASERRQRDLESMQFSDPYLDGNDEWCCGVTIFAPDGAPEDLVFAWDVETGKVNVVGGEYAQIPRGLFITARNAAKDKLREASAHAARH